MAKVDIGQMSPDAVPRIRGIFLVMPWRNGWKAQKWPRRRGPSKNPVSQWYAAQFAYAARWSANPNPLDYATAVAMTKGTDWMPRDLLMRAIYGTAYEVILPDGTIMTVTDKGPPQPGGFNVQQWQGNLYGLLDDASSSTSSFAFKGTIVTAQIAAQIDGILVRFSPTVGGLFKVCLCRLDASNVIQEVYNSTSFQASTGARQWYPFSFDAPLLNGERYALLVGRTDSTPTYKLNAQFNKVGQWQAPIQNLFTARLATTQPAVGQTVDNAGGAEFAMPFQLLMTF